MCRLTNEFYPCYYPPPHTHIHTHWIMSDSHSLKSVARSFLGFMCVAAVICFGLSSGLQGIIHWTWATSSFKKEHWPPSNIYSTATMIREGLICLMQHAWSTVRSRRRRREAVQYLSATQTKCQHRRGGTVRLLRRRPSSNTRLAFRFKGSTWTQLDCGAECFFHCCGHEVKICSLSSSCPHRHSLSADFAVCVQLEMSENSENTQVTSSFCLFVRQQS